MSREGGKSGRSMTPDEAELWDRLGQSVDKVKNKPRVTPHDNTRAPAPPPRAQVAPEPEHKRPKPPSAAKVEQPAPKPRRLPPLAEFDRRSVRQVASGKIGIDAHLDLHGVRRRDARCPAARLSICLPGKRLQDRARRYRQGRGIG